MPLRDLLECTALITGASSGLGREFARQLAPLAARLILVARRQERLEELRAELLTVNPELRVDCRPLDLADPVQLERLTDELTEGHAELDFLINNAGLGDRGEFETSERAKVDRMVKVNVLALTTLCHRLIPLLRHHRPGAILNVSSVAGMLPVPEMAVYAASKAYVSSLSEALRAELRGTGITVTHLCPGPVETEFHQVAWRAGGHTPPEAPMPSLFNVSVERVVREALLAVVRDRPRVVPGTLMALTALGLALTPLFVLRFFFRLNQEAEQARRQRLGGEGLTAPATTEG